MDEAVWMRAAVHLPCLITALPVPIRRIAGPLAESD